MSSSVLPAGTLKAFQQYFQPGGEGGVEILAFETGTDLGDVNESEYGPGSRGVSRDNEPVVGRAISVV